MSPADSPSSPSPGFRGGTPGGEQGTSLFSVDAHAHIAPDVTDAQIEALGNTLVFAMTRSISEARIVANQNDARLVWGLGVHPGVPGALAEYDEALFARAIQHFAVVGEVGLDRRGDRVLQSEVLKSILRVAKDEPVVVSIHSTGRINEVLDLLHAEPHRGTILHWFNGSPEQIAEATALGCHFSVNSAMDPSTIAAMPPEKLLTETDFPSSRRRTQARVPGDVSFVETVIEDVHQLSARDLVHANLRQLLEDTGAVKRLAQRARTRLAWSNG